MKRQNNYLKWLMMSMHTGSRNYLRRQAWIDRKDSTQRSKVSLRRKNISGLYWNFASLREMSLAVKKIRMSSIPIRTTVVGSYPFPGWLEFASRNLDKFGPADVEEMIEDAVIAAIHDQVTAGLDVITDGEQTRLDFNLSFYGFLKGIEKNETETRKFGPAAHDQR